MMKTHKDVPQHSTDGRALSYQAALRAIGHYLDERSAYRVHVLESADSFAIRYQEQLCNPTVLTAHFTKTELLQRDETGSHHRHANLPFGRPVLQPWRDRSYENSLRALGAELDDLRAYTLLLDEADEGTIVTYQYLTPSEGFQVRKRLVIIGDDGMRAVEEDRAARRAQRRSGIVSLLAS